MTAAIFAFLATRHYSEPPAPTKIRPTGLPLPLRQLPAGSPGSAGSFEGLVQGGEIAVEQRMEVLQGRLELGSRDLVILAVRAGRCRRGRPVAADDGLDPLDQADLGGCPSIRHLSP